MLRQNKISQKQMQAMQHLRQISQSPWAMDTNLPIHKSVDLVDRKIKTSMSIRQTRPFTQQLKNRHKNLIIQTHVREPVYQNILKAPNSEIRNVINFSKQLKRGSFFESPQIDKQLIQTSVIGFDRKKQNYSDLRKTFEKDFFIGTKNSMKSINRLQHNNSLNMSRNSKKGRLWVGRPILLFNYPHSLRSNQEQSSQGGNRLAG